MGKSIKMAWRNMWRNWRRTSIALVAIVLGLMLLLLGQGLIQGSDQAIFGNAVRLYGGNLQVHAPGFREKAARLPMLPLEKADAIVAAAQEQPGVTAVTQRIATSGLVSNREGAYPVSITAIVPSLEAAHSIQAEHVIAGRYLEDGEGDAVLVGKGLADALKVGVGDRVNVVGRSTQEQMRQRTMTIVGIFDLGIPDLEKGMVFITVPEAQSLYGLRDQVTEVAILLDSMNLENATLTNLRGALPAHEVDSWSTLRPEIKQTLATKQSVSLFLGFIVMLIASIGVLNLMLMAVFERTREMGVLAALGMKGRQIMGLFLLEGLFIGLVGGVLGALLGWGLVTLLGQVGLYLGDYSGMGDITALMGNRLYPAVGLDTALMLAAVVAIIAMLASAYPAWQASRKEPATALHTV